MIEFKARGNGLLEARGQDVDFELNRIKYETFQNQLQYL